MIAEILAAIVAVAVGTAGAFKFGVPAVRKAHRFSIMIHETTKRIEHIYHEVTPNSGGSLKDQVVKLTKDVGAIRGAFEKIEARQAATINILPQPTWEASEQGLYRFVNRSFLRILGATPDEVKGNGWEDFVLEEDRSRVWTEWTEAVAKRKSFSASYRIFNQTTHAVYLVTARTNPFFNGNQLIGWMGSFTSVEPCDTKLCDSENCDTCNTRSCIEDTSNWIYSAENRDILVPPKN